MINFLNNSYNLKTKLLILRTDINTDEKLKTIEPFFNKHPNVLKWSIDIEDVDNVLKIKVSKYFNENDIINVIKNRGFNCSDLDKSLQLN